MRRLTFVAATFLAACSSGSSHDGTYLSDASYRRSEFVASLVNPSNGYAKTRLAHYDSGDANDWSRLPELNPHVAPLDQNGKPGQETTFDLSDPTLGIQAFFRYPVQEIASTFAEPENAGAAGFWSDATHGLGGLVRVTYDDGFSAIAMTCSTCHAREDAGKLTVGVANPNLDFGWGPSRIDVTTTDGTEPVAIADLRPVKFLGYLHHDANVKARDLTTLAIRIETLIITSHEEVSRPPRQIALALAQYVWSLADALPLPPSNAAVGADVFAKKCASCHDPQNNFTGEPVPIDIVGTDPTLGLSHERGTGNYRVPSLRGLGTRSPLLHDASVLSIDGLLDPSRTNGHAFGLDLDDASRAALVSYLKAL
jgi:mono/diheme cytochrome c family protein